MPQMTSKAKPSHTNTSSQTAFQMFRCNYILLLNHEICFVIFESFHPFKISLTKRQKAMTCAFFFSLSFIVLRMQFATLQDSFPFFRWHDCTKQNFTNTQCQGSKEHFLLCDDAYRVIYIYFVCFPILGAVVALYIHHRNCVTTKG